MLFLSKNEKEFPEENHHLIVSIKPHNVALLLTDLHKMETGDIDFPTDCYWYVVTWKDFPKRLLAINFHQSAGEKIRYIYFPRGSTQSMTRTVCLSWYGEREKMKENHGDILINSWGNGFCFCLWRLFIFSFCCFNRWRYLREYFNGRFFSGVSQLEKTGKGISWSSFVCNWQRIPFLTI